MSEWAIVTLREVSEVITKGTTPTTLGMVFTDCGVNFIKSESITADGRIDVGKFAFIDEATHASLKRSQIKANDLLFSMAGVYLGKTAVVPPSVVPANTNQAVAIIRLKKEIVDPRYVGYFLRQPSFNAYVNNLVGQSAQPNINLTEIGRLKIKLPPLETQQEIARILGDLDEKIELNRQINQTLEQIAQTLFKSWFVDFEPVKAKLEAKAAGRDPERAAMCAISGKLEPELDQLPPEQYQQLAATATLFPNELVESELGLIPVGWEISEIGKEVTVVGGSTPSTANPDFWNGEFAWVTPKDLSRLSEKVLTCSERTISGAGVSKISSGQLPVGTVLLSSRAPIGYLALTMIPVSINQGFIAMLCNKRLPNAYVLQWATVSLDAIKQRGSGTTFAEISKSNFRAMSVLVPGSEALDAFQQLVLPLYEQITASVHEAETLATLRDTLLPKLLSGELSVENLPLEATA